VNGLESKLKKKPEDSSCSCSDLLPAISKLIKQNTAVIEQSSTLIELIEIKDQMVLTLVEQNTELISRLTEESEEESLGSTYLDTRTL